MDSYSEVMAEVGQVDAQIAALVGEAGTDAALEALRSERKQLLSLAFGLVQAEYQVAHAAYMRCKRQQKQDELALREATFIKWVDRAAAFI